MPGLDLLRIVAGLALIVCHAGFWLAAFRLPDSVWMLLGHAGVEVFLVAFGFLLGERLLKAPEPSSIPREWARSALRLWPLYLIFLLCNLALWPGDIARLPWISYLTLTQNLAWPHPEFFGEAWIVAAAALIALVVPALCRVLRDHAFASGLLWLICLLLVGIALRGLLVWLGDPVFDSGVRKILIARLDLPVYGVTLAWLWIHRYAAVMHWRGWLAVLGAALLVATAFVHLSVPLDQSLTWRILLFPLCDLAWFCLLPWACSLSVPAVLARPASVLAGSAYAGLLTHVTALRLASAKGLWLGAGGALSGLAMLLSFVSLAVGLAVLVRMALDRNLLDLRERWLPRVPEHFVPVPKR